MKKSFGKTSLKIDTTVDNAVNKKMRLAAEMLDSQPESALALTDELLVDNCENLLLWVVATKANLQLGRFTQANECVDKALSIDPNHVESIYAKSDLLYRSERLTEAELYLKESISRIPTAYSRPLRHLYATILQKQKKYEDAQRIYKQLTDEEPTNFLYWNNLGIIRQDLSQFNEMDEAYERSCALTKVNLSPYFNRIVGAHYNPQCSARDILNLCKNWQEKFTPKLLSRAVAKNKAADKCIRIGLVSDGLRMHPVGQMIITGLEHIPASQIEFYAYSTNYKEDHLTHRLKRMCAKWMVIENTTAVDLNNIIRGDDIDIVFDLCGYNSNSRMETMQLAPAPLLIKWVGGLISSTGLETMDYLLSDSVETPEWADALYTEKLIRMPDDYICYDPPFYLPAINDNPFKKNGYITFGCFNNASKINEVLLSHWAVLMHNVPDSRLFLKSFNFDNIKLAEHVLSILETHGINRERVRIEGMSPHQALLASYNDVDIALDPWPYSGGLTTCEAMAMGVPVVTLPGPTFAGRHSASHLVNAGLQELVATDWSHFIEITVGLTRDLNSLEIIRRNLREILLMSPVCDGQRFAKNFAVAMRAVWQRYCEGKQPEALTLINDAAPYFHDDNQPVELQMPTDVAISTQKEEYGEFNFHLAGKLLIMDFGGGFAISKKFIGLTDLNAFFFIVMDTLGVVEEKHLPLKRKSIQHIKLHALGNGEIVPVYMCMNNQLSSTLKPRGDIELKGGEVLAEIQSQTSKLDEIHGLDRLELLALDNKYDLRAVFEYGSRIVRDCLVIEVKISFVDTHQGQMSFSAIADALHNYGFEFQAFHDVEYGQPVCHEKYAEIASSKMVSARAVFIPNETNTLHLDNNRREKLAFILHSVYEMKDAAWHVLAAGSVARADDYLGSLNGEKSTFSSAPIISTAKSIIPFMPRMSNSEIELFERCVKQANAYFEFGSGGSTKLATRNNVAVYGVESDKFWVDTLHNETGELCKVEYVDIGPTKECGYPVDDSHKEKFVDYSEAILKYDNAFDFILVDGRFRVACTLNAIKHTILKQKNKSDTRIFIHDFWNRVDYHDVLKFLDTEHVVESAGVFRIKNNINVSMLEDMLEKYKYIAV